MQQILELNPDSLKEQFAGVLEPIEKLGSLSLPNLNFDLSKLAVPDSLSSAVEMGQNLSEMFQKFPADPQDFIRDLLGELDNMGESSGQIGELLGPLSSLTGTLGPVMGDLQPAPAFFQNELFPALQMVSRQVGTIQSWLTENETINLGQLFQLDSLAAVVSAQFSQLLEEQLKSLSGFESFNQLLNEGDWKAAFNQTLQTLQTLDLNDTGAVQTTRLMLESGGQLKGQVDSGLATLTEQTKQANQLLEQFNAGLTSFETNISSALDTALVAIDPNVAGAKFTTELVELVAIVDKLKLGSLKSNIEKAVQTVEKVIAQNLDKVTSAIDQVVAAITNALDLAEQALVKASALLSNLVQELGNLIKKLDLPGVVKQVQEVQADLKAKITDVLDKINATVAQLYTFIEENVIAPVKQINFQSVVQLLNETLHNITTVLEHPQVQDAIKQAQKGVDLVVKKLESVSLKPTFDEVLKQSDEVKTTLKSINVSQLNPLLKEGLSLALNGVRSAIEPPQEKIATPIYEEYQKQVSPLVRQPIEFLIEQFAKIEEIVKKFEPGTVVAKLLTPPFEAMLKKLDELLDPQKLVGALQPVQDFYKDMLVKIDQTLNPTKLLAPVQDFYDKLLGAAKAITPKTLLDPVNKGIKSVTGLLEKIGLEGIINTVVSSVEQITGLVTGFRLEDTGVWQEIDKVLALDFLAELQKQLDSLLAQAGSFIDGLDLSALQDVLKALTAAVKTIQDAVLNSALLTKVDEIGVAAQSFAASLTGFTKEWQVQLNRITDFQPAVLTDDYTALQKLVQAFSPIDLLAAPAQLVDQLGTLVRNVAATLSRIWKKLNEALTRNGHYLTTLLANNATALKDYLKQILDALAGKPMKAVLEALSKPLKQISDALNVIKTAILKLQDCTKILNKIPESLRIVGDKIVEVKNKITNFDLNFLATGIQTIFDEVVKPLEMLNPNSLITDLQEVFRQILEMLDSLNPVAIIASARATLQLERGSQPDAIEIPFGTQLVATTPVGEISYHTLQKMLLPADQTAVEVMVQADLAGRSGDLVSVDGVSWRVAETGAIASLKPLASAPILSLTTLGREVILEKVKLLHPAKLVAEPLNEAFKKILAVLDSLGINKIFDTLLKKFESLEQDLKQGLDRSAAALSAVLAAMPL